MKLLEFLPPSLPLLVFINFLWLHYSSWHWTESFSLSFFYLSAILYTWQSPGYDYVSNVFMKYTFAVHLGVCRNVFSTLWGPNVHMMTGVHDSFDNNGDVSMVSVKKSAWVAFIFKTIRWWFYFILKTLRAKRISFCALRRRWGWGALKYICVSLITWE